jgi:hypothetical protein
MIEDVQREWRQIPRYLVRYVGLVLVLFGLFDLWEAHGDGTIPMILPLCVGDPCDSSSRQCAAVGASDQSRWLGLSPALAILDQVDPPVAAWVRQQHDKGTLLFSDEYSGRIDKEGSFAKFDQFRRRLIVHRALFDETDGSVAAILCHEYRHSRQNPAKVFKYALSFLFRRNGDPSIVENDAELYEHEARTAIFGQYPLSLRTVSKYSGKHSQDRAVIPGT